MKTVCRKHEQAYDADAGCPWCEPEPAAQAATAAHPFDAYANAWYGDQPTGGGLAAWMPSTSAPSFFGTRRAVASDDDEADTDDA